MEQFVILCHPRCGSTLLMEALGTHPAVHQGSEILNPVLEGIADYVDWRRAILPQLYGSADSYLTEWGYLDDTRFDLSRLLERFFQDFNGAKIMYDQAPVGSKVWPYLQGLPDLKVIELSRNPIEAAVSFQTAMQTNVWHVEASDANPVAPRLQLELEFFEWFYNHFCAPRDLIIPKFDLRQILRLTYRDLTTNWKSTIEHTQRHLGIPVRPLEQRFRQRRIGSIAQQVENWSQLRPILAQHPIFSPYVADLEIA